MGIGDAISQLFGSKNKVDATRPEAKGYAVNQNAYEYGGQQGGADASAERYRQLGDWGQSRQAEQADYGQANYDRQMGLQARGNEMDTRGQQQQVGNLMLARARGEVPSIAGMQADRQAGQLAAQQSSAAASARGAAGLALAQQNAAGNTAAGQSAISNQAQINAANERLQAEQAAGGQFNSMRQGDLATRQGDLASQGQNAQQEQYQAGMRAQQRGANDQYQLGMTQAEMGVRGQQLAAQQNREAQTSSNTIAAQGINAGVQGQNAAMNQQNTWGAIGLVKDTLGGAASLPGKASGGPVEGKRPYLVGEQGPELIIPAKDGVVIPAPETKAILHGGGLAGARAEGGPVMAGGGAPTWGVTPTTDENFTDPNVGPDGHTLVSRQAAIADYDQHGGPMGQAVDRQNQSKLAAYQKYRNAGLELSDDEAREERRIMANGATDKKPASGEKKPDAKAAPAQQKPAPNAAMGIASSINTAYQPMGGHAGPTLVALPQPQVVPRAFGGPIQAGGAPTFDALAPGGGMDVMGSLRNHSNAATSFLKSPGSGPVARADGGPVQGGGAPAEYLYEPPGQQIRMNPSGLGATYAQEPTNAPPMATMSGPASIFTSRMGPPPSPTPGAGLAKAKKKQTDDDLLAQFDKMRAEVDAKNAAMLAQGPAVKGSR